ncbi:hypothetical protein [Tenacibaculum xiamenense]|uniref:hypothetical protein n=1 Tax=Tenacibaculum xiamenense TaxID=1261553 RepID=UPI0038931C9D
MELTKLQIQQINNFLEAIGIEYMDIRFEMVDHIASELEDTIENLDEFFEDNRLHTPFLKYMMSKKESYKKKYDRIVKRKFWSDSISILKDVLIQTFKPLNALVLSLIATGIFFSLTLENNYIMYFLATIAMGYSAYYLIATKKFMKTYGKLKIIQSYNLTASIVSNVALQVYIIFYLRIPNDDLITFLINPLLITFLVYFPFGSSLMAQMENIENKYKQIIQ